MNFCKLVLVMLFSVLQVGGAGIINADTQDIGSFWQITDIHWDTRYSLSGISQNMCHDPSPNPPPANVGGAVDAPPNPPHAIVGDASMSSDYHHRVRQELRQRRASDTSDKSDVRSPNGDYGNYLCDSPWKLVKASLNAMQTLKRDVNFILWTGDMAPHVKDPEPNFSLIFSTLNNVTTELKKRFSPSEAGDEPAVPVLPVLGNHDAYPKDQYPDCPRAFYQRYLQEGGWSTLLSTAQQDSFSKGGYYSLDAGSVQVAVLNTNLYYVFNSQGINDPDPCDQFSWLSGLLNDARTVKRKVILAAHSPPGFFERLPVIPFLNDTYNTAYVRLVGAYGDVIHSHVYGHLHTDTFRIFLGDNGAADSVAFLAPSVTPWQAAKLFGGTAINPSLRLYTYDAASVLDYTQYHLNLTQANTDDQQQQDVPATVVADGSSAASGGRAPVAGVGAQSDVKTDSVEVKSVVDGNAGGGENLVKHVEGSLTTDGIISAYETTEATLMPPGDLRALNRDLKSIGEGKPVEASSTEVTLSDHQRTLQSVIRTNASVLNVEGIPDATLIETAVPGVAMAHQLDWEIYYEARKAYSLDRLDATNMNTLYSRLAMESDLFDKYYERNSAGIDNGKCNNTCKTSQLCAIKCLTTKELFTCMNYNKTHFTELLSSTFKKVNPLLYSHYFPADELPDHPAVATPTSSNHYTVSGAPSPHQVMTDAPDVGGSNSSNPHHPLEATVVSYSMPVSVMVGSVVMLWMILGALYFAVRWRRRGRVGGVVANAGRAVYHQGYTPISSHDDD